MDAQAEEEVRLEFEQWLATRNILEGSRASLAWDVFKAAHVRGFNDGIDAAASASNSGMHNYQKIQSLKR